MASIAILRNRRLASQLTQAVRGMATFGSARPGEPTGPISDAHRGPTGVLEVRSRATAQHTVGRSPCIASTLAAPPAARRAPIARIAARTLRARANAGSSASLHQRRQPTPRATPTSTPPVARRSPSAF